MQDTGSRTTIFLVSIFSSVLLLRSSPVSARGRDRAHRASSKLLLCVSRHPVFHVNLFFIVFWYVRQAPAPTRPSMLLSKNSIKVQFICQQQFHEGTISAGRLSKSSAIRENNSKTTRTVSLQELVFFLIYVSGSQWADVENVLFSTSLIENTFLHAQFGESTCFQNLLTKTQRADDM